MDSFQNHLPGLLLNLSAVALVCMYLSLHNLIFSLLLEALSSTFYLGLHTNNKFLH